jgi:hypothetical protein
MSMRFDYDHDVDTVFNLITDPDYYKARCEFLGEKNIKVDKAETGDEITMNIERTIESDLPKVLAKMFSNENTIVSTLHWKNHGEGEKKTGHYKADVQGQPVTISAEFELVPQGDTCEYVISHSAKAKVPLVGKKIEKYIIEQTEETVPDEITYDKQKLAQQD